MINEMLRTQTFCSLSVYMYAVCVHMCIFLYEYGCARRGKRKIENGPCLSLY